MRLAVLAFLVLLLVSACKSGGSLFSKRSPHQEYADKLEKVGLKQTSLGTAWFTAAEQSLSNPVNISIPFRETGYFSAEAPGANGYLFTAPRGQKLTFTLNKNPGKGFNIFLELWRPAGANNTARLITSLDSTTSSFSYEVEQANESFILRIQPELLHSGEYTITIQNGPSLAFPVKTTRQVISSFWGDPRDGGGRKHEGVDIFAPRGTPVIASATGNITRANENNLGGKTVWLRPSGKNYTLYYAHLDQQLVEAGQKVKAGDTIATVGNTGNAKTTAPHLHFGIYTGGGAIDPALFIQPAKQQPPAIAANIDLIGRMVRASASSKLYTSPSTGSGSPTAIEKHVPFKVQAATAGWYKIILPTGEQAYIQQQKVQALDQLRRVIINQPTALLESPGQMAPRKLIIEKGQTVQLLATYLNFSYVEYNNSYGWIPI